LDRNSIDNIELLQWNELVYLKRKSLASIREFAENIIAIDTNRIPQINQKIHEQKKILKTFLPKAKQNQIDIQQTSSDLLAISEKISKSKNFLSTMQHRLPVENEENLLHIIQYNESIIKEKKYANSNEKDQIFSRTKDASMKIDAIRAFRTVKEQLLYFETQCEAIKKSFNTLNEENSLCHRKIGDCNMTIKALLDSKHQIAKERGSYLQSYNELLLHLGKINARLDMMAKSRKRQNQRYPNAISRDELLKARELAKRKLQSGSKLSFDELRLLYNDN